MTPLLKEPRPTSAQIDGYCCSGTSPGRVGAFETLTIFEPASVRPITVEYEVHGPDDAPATVVLGGISANRHLCATVADPSPGWWPGIVGDGCVLDPQSRRLVGLDYLAPETETAVSTRRQARAVVGVLDELAIESARIVGASYGGMVGLAVAEEFGDRVDSLIVLGAAHRPHPMATALRHIQRRIAPVDIALARSLAMTTYRSAAEFEARFDWRPAEDGSFDAVSYLDARGRAFSRDFAATRYVRLSESIDAHAVDARRVKAPTTLISFDSDQIAPPWLVEELERLAPGVTQHSCIHSDYGHDAFLKEVGPVSEAIQQALAQEVGR